MVWAGSPKCGVAGPYKGKPGTGLGEAGMLLGPDPQADLHPAVPTDTLGREIMGTALLSDGSWTSRVERDSGGHFVGHCQVSACEAK